MPRILLRSGPEAPSAGLGALDRWLAGVGESVADRVRIAAGELLGNAVAHGPGSPFWLEWIPDAEGGELRIVGGGAVAAEAFQQAKLPATESTRGRGLYIVRAVADTLTVGPDGTVRLGFRP